MRSPRRSSGRLIAIIGLVALAVTAIISIGEGFKAVLIRKATVQLEKRDGSSTVTLNMPWEPVNASTRPELKGFKDVSQDVESSLIGDIAAVASAILGGSSEVVNAASAGAAALLATPSLGTSSVLDAGSADAGPEDAGSASAASVLREVNGQIQQATSIVAAVLGDATSIVGSILAAATSPSNIGVLPIANSNSSMNGTASSSGGLISSISSLRALYPNTTIFALPCSSSVIASVTAELAPLPTTLSCATAMTETRTVTETWHSTHYAETATFYSFIANSTVTYTETASGCSPPLLYLPDPTATIPPHQNIVTCANGVLAKRGDDCHYNLNATFSQSLSKSASALDPASSPASTHPCPNAGYSCTECPDGWFCPPHPTSAQNCICGFGWACVNCKDGYFCIPSPTPAGSGLINTVASFLTTPATPSIPSNMASITTNPPTLKSLGSMVPIPTGTVTCIDGTVVLMAKECLNDVSATSNIVDITIINMPMAADLAVATGITGLGGHLLGTTKTDSSPLLSNAQLVATGLGNAASSATPNVASLPFPLFNDPTVALPIIQNGNPMALSDITKLMMAGIPTNLPVANVQPDAADLGDRAGNDLPKVTAASILPTTATAQFSTLNNIPSATPKHGPNAAENMFNQLMNGAPTNSPVLNGPAVPMLLALGPARGRRRA